MKRNTKLAIGAGVGLLALGGLAYALAGSSKPTTTTGTGTGKGGGHGGGGGHHGGGHGGDGGHHAAHPHARSIFPRRGSVYAPYDYAIYDEPSCTYLGMAGTNRVPPDVSHYARNLTWVGQTSQTVTIGLVTYRLDALPSGIAVYECPDGYAGLSGPPGYYVQQGHIYNLTLSTSWSWQQALSALSMAGWQIVSPENAPVQGKWLGNSTTISLAMPVCQPSADPNQPWNWPCGVTITAISDVAGAPPPASLPGQGPAPKPAPLPGQKQRPSITRYMAVTRYFPGMTR
jgi:hypothetical protein